MTVFSDNAEWSTAAATVAAVPVWGKWAPAIIKLQIGITLWRFNGVLWLRTSFAAVFGPRLTSPRLSSCVISLFKACRSCLPLTQTNFQRANEVWPIKCCHSHSHPGVIDWWLKQERKKIWLCTQTEKAMWLWCLACTVMEGRGGERTGKWIKREGNW